MRSDKSVNYFTLLNRLIRQKLAPYYYVRTTKFSLSARSRNPAERTRHARRPDLAPEVAFEKNVDVLFQNVLGLYRIT